MSRGVCMTRAPVVRVRGGWGGTHLRYLAVKSAVRYWAITILPLDSSLTLMEWVGEVFKSLSIGGWQIWEGVPPPQLLLVCYEQLPRTIQGEGGSALMVGAFSSSSLSSLLYRFLRRLRRCFRCGPTGCLAHGFLYRFLCWRTLGVHLGRRP